MQRNLISIEPIDCLRVLNMDCSKKNVDVVCIDKVEDAQAIFRRIQEFKKRFFEESDVTCV